jgi:hypothetical protein
MIVAIVAVVAIILMSNSFTASSEDLVGRAGELGWTKKGTDDAFVRGADSYIGSGSWGKDQPAETETDTMFRDGLRVK